MCLEKVEVVCLPGGSLLSAVLRDSVFVGVWRKLVASIMTNPGCVVVHEIVMQAR